MLSTLLLCNHRGGLAGGVVPMGKENDGGAAPGV
jgi:hypothetical protein